MITRCLAVAVSLLLLPSPHVGAQSGGRPVWRVFVSATGDHDAPVSDLTPADLVVKEDGRTREVLSVEPAKGPMQIVVLVDDDGSGVFRFGLEQFALLLQGRATISLRIIRGQVQEVFGFTPDVDRWMAGFRQMGVRASTPGGGQLIEGVFDAASELKQREAERPVIVALTTGTGEQSPRRSDVVLNALRESGASLQVVYAVSPRPSAPATRASDLLEGNFDLDQVLGDGPKETGGVRRDVIASGVIRTEVQKIARDLLNQLAVTYTRPERWDPPRRLGVTTSRRGVKITAPTRAPIR